MSTHSSGKKINDFVINVATVNGSGSQSANTILLKTLFRMGVPVGGKNVFPSNIQGLPTWFWIRANEKGYTSPRIYPDIVVALNPQTFLEDQKNLKEGGVFIYNSDQNISPDSLRKDIFTFGVPFKKIVDQATTAIKIKKLLTNVIYVGVLAELLDLDNEALTSALNDQFKGKASVLESNTKALELGREFARQNLDSKSFPFKAEKRDLNKGKIILDGNTATALGFIYGGATVAAWYPITPSSSIVENFSQYATRIRTNADGTKNFAILQAEDELASICAVMGAGWMGARAFTATSGPGLSLMQEASGFAYYAEIPSVIWDVQRVGPSTGMPTRTAQGDIFSAVFASHGDTKNPCLIPGSPEECFEFGQTCFDLAERLQQLVIVLSDLELGMNLWMSNEFSFPTKPFDRGKVVNADDITKMKEYFRYTDYDGDAIPYRALPGTKHPLAAYTVRGSGHTKKALYTEKGTEYQELVDRLARKWDTAKKYVPAPLIDGTNKKLGVICYGVTQPAIEEARDILKSEGIDWDILRIRAIPFTPEIENFVINHEKIFVLDLNRDAQMHQLIKMDMPQHWNKLTSIKHYDGTPVTADFVAQQIKIALQGGLS